MLQTPAWGPERADCILNPISPLRAADAAFSCRTDQVIVSLSGSKASPAIPALLCQLIGRSTGFLPAGAL